MKPATSSSALAIPTIASSTSASHWLETAARTTNGSPQSAIATPDQRANGASPTSNAALANDPTTAPAPNAAMRTPTPASPVPSTSMAITTENTVKQPRVKV